VLPPDAGGSGDVGKDILGETCANENYAEK
jgi:hypothetical protein